MGPQQYYRGEGDTWPHMLVVDSSQWIPLILFRASSVFWGQNGFKKNKIMYSAIDFIFILCDIGGGLAQMGGRRALAIHWPLHIRVSNDS